MRCKVTNPKKFRILAAALRAQHGKQLSHVFVRGNTDHRIDLFDTDGQWYWFRGRPADANSAEIEPDWI